MDYLYSDIIGIIHIHLKTERNLYDMRKNKITTCLVTFVTISLIISAGCKKKPETQPEFRGVWLHTGLFSPQKEKAVRQMDSLFTLYQETGINNLFCYNSAPGENSFTWDYLQTLIDEGNKKNIRIHPIFYPGYTVNLEKEIVDHPHWLIRGMDGQYEPHFNIANPEVREYWIDRIKATFKYDIAGIHLDYIRFPITQMYSYDSLTCELFKREFQYSPLEVSHDCGSMIWCEWIKWNSRQVTEFLKEIQKAVKNSEKPLLLGADVFPDMETADVLIAQNWKNWAENGLVDFLCPMLYTNNLDLFREYVRNAMNAAGNNCKVYPGIGIHTSHNDITGELLIKEVEITREERTNGMVFFSGYSFNKEMMDTLNATLF